MLKAKQIQKHKRAKTTTHRLGKTTNDKSNEGGNDVNGYADRSDTEDNSNVNKRIKRFQSIIDEKHENM
eukprot:8914671-Heterocapsa_arctica.AAC.1